MKALSLPTVPHLLTANPHLIENIERHILEHQDEIEIWLRQQFYKSPAPFYASVDLRNAGFKLAPVDTNLFPAGFNNLNSASKPLCIQAFQIALERFFPNAKGIVIIPESHTRNLKYLDNVVTIQEYITLAGYHCYLGTLREDIVSPSNIDLPSGRQIPLNPIHREGNSTQYRRFYTVCSIIEQ